MKEGKEPFIGPETFSDLEKYIYNEEEKKRATLWRDTSRLRKSKLLQKPKSKVK